MQNKKINQLSAIWLMVSSMLGAGIFVKAKTINELSHSSIPATFVLLVLSVFLVITLLFCLALISSKQMTSQGYIEWTEKYCPHWFNSITVNYTRYIYQPISFVVIGIYFFQIWWKDVQYLWLLILGGFLLSAVFLFINFISFNFAAKLQLFLLSIVFCAILVLPILGMLSIETKTGKEASEVLKPTSLNGFGPWMVIISGLPSIFFMYDGFYSSLVYREKLNKPHYLNKCLVIAFIIISFLYLYVIISFNLLGWSKKDKLSNNHLFESFFNVCISAAAILTLNASAMSGPKQLVAIYKNYQFKDVNILKKKLFKNVYDDKLNVELTIWIYLLLKVFLWFIGIGVIAIFSGFGTTKNEAIYKINDSIAGVCSSLIFAIIASVIICLTNKLEFESSRRKVQAYKFAAYFSSSIIFLAIFYNVINSFVGMFGVNNADRYVSGFEFFLFVVFILVSSKKQIADFFSKLRNRRINNLLE